MGTETMLCLLTPPDQEDWQEYLAVDSDQDNRIDFDDNGNQTIDPAEIDTYIDNADSGTHGIDNYQQRRCFCKRNHRALLVCELHGAAQNIRLLLYQWIPLCSTTTNYTDTITG